MWAGLCSWLCKFCGRQDESRFGLITGLKSDFDADARVTHRQESESVGKQLEDCRVECARWQSSYEALQRDRQRVPTVGLPTELADLVSHLRKDEALCSHFALNAAADDLDMLIQTVAVLAQEANLRRLWEMYRHRCEHSGKAPTADDVRILKVALGWHNQNWPDKPYVLNQPSIGDAYDFEKHLRGTIGMKGEKIHALWLPGISGLKLKPVVATI